MLFLLFFFFSSRRRHTRYWRDWSSDVCSSDLDARLEHLVRARLLGLGDVIARVGGAEIGRASCRERSVDLGGRRIIKKKKTGRAPRGSQAPAPLAQKTQRAQTHPPL